MTDDEWERELAILTSPVASRKQFLAAFSTVWREVHEELLPFFRSRGYDIPSDDLIQEVAVKIAGTLPEGFTLDGPAKPTFLHWIRTIARNVLFDHFRRSRPRPLVELNFPVLEHLDIEIDNPPEELSDPHFRKYLEKLFSELNGKQQNLLRRYLEGATFVNRDRVGLHRLRRYLLAQIEKYAPEHADHLRRLLASAKAHGGKVRAGLPKPDTSEGPNEKMTCISECDILEKENGEDDS